MFCPQCEAEYREGYDTCEECGVALVPSLPVVDHTAEHYESVYETSRPADVPVIKSLLKGAGIPYVTEGDSMMNLFPSEAAMTIMTSKGHAELRFLVPSDKAEDARALLAEDPQIETIPDELRGDDEAPEGTDAD